MPLKTVKIPWRTKCCVEGCATRVCSGVPMHGFPRVDRHPELYQHWVDAVRLANKTPNWNPLKSNKVCAFHFETVGDCRLRVPTVFPHIERPVASTSEDYSYEDFDEDDDAGDYEDPMDTYEDSIAASSIMPEDGSTLPYSDVEDTGSTVAYMDEDSAMTYEDIEERYNTIVGDVVSTLVTDDNVMDEDTNITYGEVEEDADPVHNSNEVEESSTQYNQIEEEIIYDDGDYMLDDGDASAILDDGDASAMLDDGDASAILDEGDASAVQTPIFSAEQIGLNQDDLGDNEYCVVVVRQESNETKPESTKNVAPSESKVESGSTNKKSATKKLGKKGPLKKFTGKMVTVKAAKPLPASSEPSEGSAAEGSAAVPEDSTISLSKEVKEMLLKSQEVLPNETDTVKLKQQESSSRKAHSKSPSKKVKTKLVEKKISHSKKLPSKQEQQETSPTEREENETLAAEKSPAEQEEEKTAPTDGEQKETLQTEKPPVDQEEPKKAPGGGEQKETSTAEKSPVDREERKTSPNKGHEKETTRESECVKSKGVNGVKINDLLLDGEPIKLKECSVNIVKTPVIPKSKNKSQSASKVKNAVQKNEDQVEKKEIVPSGSMEQDSGNDDKVVPGNSSEFLNALSLKSSQDESANSGLRRSARIRAGAGKRRKFGTRSSWSVAFKDPPKKKLKVEIDETSQSSESIPYDFENEDDPDVGVSDLEGSDTTMSDDASEGESDISSRSAKKPKSQPQPRMNGVTTGKRGRMPYSATAEGTNRPKFHGYHRVRFGDQATQVGLPGKCDGFIFDVVRDDPRNVGVSCNIFYHYQPKNNRHHSNWAKYKKGVEPSSTAATKNCVKTQISTDSSQKTEPTNKHAQRAVHIDTAGEGKSRNDKTHSVSKQSKNLECDERAKKYLKNAASKNSRFQDTNTEFVDVVENPDERVKVDSGATDGLNEPVNPESICVFGGIKIEPAMVIPPGVDSESGLVENAEVGGASQKTDDINLMGNAGEFAEVQVKEEEEFHDSEDVEMVRVVQDSCILTDLCEVSHDDAENGGGNMVSIGTPHGALSDRPGVAQRGKLLTELQDTDDTNRPSEQSCSAKTVENRAKNRMDDIEADLENVEEAMDTSATSSHNQADSNSSGRTEITSTECPSTASRRLELPNQDRNSATKEDMMAPSEPQIGTCSDSGNEGESFLEDGNPIAKKDSGRDALSPASGCAEVAAGDEQMGIECKRKSNEPDIQDVAGADSAKSAESRSEAETPSSRKDSDNVEEPIDSNASADPEYAAECSGELSNLAMALEPPTEAEVSRDLEGRQNGRDTDGIQEDPGDPVKCLDVASAECAIQVRTSDDRTDAEDLKITEDSDSILAHPGCETEFQDGANEARRGEDRSEVECPYSPAFSSDSSTGSLIEVPIPDIDEDIDAGEPAAPPDDCSVESDNEGSPLSRHVPEIHGDPTVNLLQASKFSISENPSVDDDSANESNLEKCLQNLGKSTDVSKHCEIPFADSPKLQTVVPNDKCTSEEEANHVQSESSQDLFDSIERNLEKMFDMDR